MLSMLEEISINSVDGGLVWIVGWGVTLTLIVAAVIDGWKLKVPNWLTYPMIFSGWAASLVVFGLPGLGCSLAGTAVGLALLLPLYAIGGMGAGDVKLLAGVGAWVGAGVTVWAFAVCAVVGAALAIAMVLIRGQWTHHYNQFLAIATEILTVRNPEKLSEAAAERKSTMMLLPYGIPIAIGSVAYFAYLGMLL